MAMEYWVMCPVCMEGNLLGRQSFEVVHRVGMEWRELVWQVHKDI